MLLAAIFVLTSHNKSVVNDFDCMWLSQANYYLPVETKCYKADPYLHVRKNQIETFFLRNQKCFLFIEILALVGRKFHDEISGCDDWELLYFGIDNWGENVSALYECIRFMWATRYRFKLPLNVHPSLVQAYWLASWMPRCFVSLLRVLKDFLQMSQSNDVPGFWPKCVVSCCWSRKLKWNFLLQ